MKHPEQAQSAEFDYQSVFEILDRASSHSRDTYSLYLIGDGISVKVGWVDKSTDNPSLILGLIDAKTQIGASLTVGENEALYTRIGGNLPVIDWLAANKQERREVRRFFRRESFSTPTESLRPIADAVKLHDKYIADDTHSALVAEHETSLTVQPLPSTDVEFIRELIQAFAMPLDPTNE